jgi:acetylornithine deacetylase/succinyl-diaminopimelate desuccinylase-like protein
MRDEHGRIAIDGFYDAVEGVPEADRELLDEFEHEEKELLDELDVGGLQDGPGETFLEKTLYYPTLNVNGLGSGHGEAGFKTIVPSDAAATIDMRLVVDQDPDRIFDLFEQHVEEYADDRLETTVTYHASMDPMRTPTDTPYFDPIVGAVTDGWGAEPIVKPSTGGSAPYALFTDYLGLPHASIPYGQTDNNQHSPNERFAVEHFRKGIRTSARLLDAVSTV